MPKKITFIVNPSSSNGTTGKKWPSIRAKAAARLGPFKTLITSGPGHAGQLAKQALASGSRILICVGGDGTFNEVINGVMNKNGSLVEPELAMGFIPQGTGCDLARSIAIPRDLDMALDNILRRRNQRIDLGRLKYIDHDRQESYRYFHNVVSFGLGGDVAGRVNRKTKIFGGFLTYILASLVSVLRYRKKRILISVDDFFNEEVVAWNVAIANGQYHGGGMWVAPDAALNDGLFHITLIGDLSLLDIFRSLPILYNGKIYEHKKVRTLIGRRIIASSSEPVFLEMDGEQPGCLPLVVEIAPSALPIICDL